MTRTELVHHSARARRARPFVAAVTALLLSAPAAAQTVSLPLTPAEWNATDSVRFLTFLGRPSIHVSKGVAMSRTAKFRNGTIEFDMAADSTSANFGIGFRAQRPEKMEVVFFRPGSSGRPEAMQYAPAINSIGAEWQIYHGPGSEAAIAVPRNTWIHVRLRVIADSALVWVGSDTAPALIIPRLVLGGQGTGVALWASLFRGGAWYSNVSYTADRTPYDTTAPPLPTGTIADWLLSPAMDATVLRPNGSLPNLQGVEWEPVRAEWPGLVLLNRYRNTAGMSPPADADSVLHGRVAGSRLVFARTTIRSDRARSLLMRFGYSDNIVIWCNGQPLFNGVNPLGLRGMGYFEPVGDAVYLPLRRGANELVVAVTDFFGGWAFSGRLDP